ANRDPSASSASSEDRATLDEEVFAEALEHYVDDRYGLAHAAEAHRADHRPAISTKELRRDEERNPIDETSCQRARCQHPSALDQDAFDARSRQVAEHSAERP